MAEIKNFPNNADEYIGAENVMKWLHGRTSGVFAAENNLAVTSEGGMNIAVSDGVGWIANSERDGTVFWNDTFKNTGALLNLSLGLADAYNPRIDRVIVTWNTVDYTDKPQIQILSGTPANTPSPPELTRNANVWQISLAQIYIDAAVSNITATNITDERLNPAVCGLVTAALEIDSSMANAQFMQTLAETKEQVQELLGLIERELENLNAGTEVMLKTVYDKNNDGVVDGLSQVQEIAEAAVETANAALPKAGGAMTGTLTDSNAAQVRNIQVSETDLTAGESELATGTVYFVYE